MPDASTAQEEATSEHVEACTHVLVILGIPTGSLHCHCGHARLIILISFDLLVLCSTTLFLEGQREACLEVCVPWVERIPQDIV
jgi:hypothetical protein